MLGGAHCCSVVTVNTSNTVQLLTLGNPTHHTPWHSGEHSGLYKILFPIFACSSLVISARGHTPPQASNHSMMRLLMEARRSDTECCSTHCDTAEYRAALSREVYWARRRGEHNRLERTAKTRAEVGGGGVGEEAGAGRARSNAPCCDPLGVGGGEDAALRKMGLRRTCRPERFSPYCA